MTHPGPTLLPEGSGNKPVESSTQSASEPRLAFIISLPALYRAYLLPLLRPHPLSRPSSMWEEIELARSMSMASWIDVATPPLQGSGGRPAPWDCDTGKPLAQQGSGPRIGVSPVYPAARLCTHLPSLISCVRSCTGVGRPGINPGCPVAAHKAEASLAASAAAAAMTEVAVLDVVQGGPAHQRTRPMALWHPAATASTPRQSGMLAALGPHWPPEQD